MRRFLFVLLSCCAVLLGGLAWYNYTHDELGILNPEFSSRRITAAENFVKTRYILGNPEKYDSFAFGSSRVAVLPLTELGDGRRWYNMSYQAGVPAEWLATLQYFVAGGVQVKTVLCGLDDASFRIDPEEHVRAFGDKVPYRPYDVETYLRLLFRRPEAPKPADFVYENGIFFDIYGTGNTPYPWRDEAIERDPAAHAASDVFWQSSARREDRLDATMRDIEELCAFARAHDIELIFFLNPLWQTTYIDNDAAELDAFRRRLAQVTDYYDFSGLNDVATDAYNFYESSHYRPVTGRRILARLFGGAAESPAGFGSYVTAETVEAHLTMLHAQQAAWEASHPDVRPRMEYERQFVRWCPPMLSGAARTDVRLMVHLDHVGDAAAVAPGAHVTWPAADAKKNPDGTLKLSGFQLPGMGVPQETAIVLRAADGSQWYLRAHGMDRPDINGMVGLADVRLGWQAEARSDGLPPGSYALSVVTRTAEGDLLASGDLMTLEKH